MGTKPTLVSCCNRCILNDNKRKACRYQTTIPAVGLCCGAYYASTTPDKRKWMHFPFCDELYCPLRHPELLDGATLERRQND